MRPMLPLLLAALALPALAQAGVSVGVGLTQYAPHGFTTAGVQLLLAPHDYNAFRLRGELTLKGQDSSDGFYQFGKVDAQIFALDYIHYRNGWRQPGFLIGCGYGSFQLNYDRTVINNGVVEHRSESLQGPHFLIGGQLSPHISLEGRVHLIWASEYPVAFLSGALSVHF